MMNDYPLPFLLLFSFFTLLPCTGAEETITITATATGETADEAETNALQNAVRKSLGEFVDAETITNNEEVIKNQVLTYSDGFVKDFTVLSGPEINSAIGKYVITIRAEVVRNKVEESLRTAKVLVTKVDGNALWLEALEGKKGIPEKQELLKKFLWEELRPERLLISRFVSKGKDGKILRGPDAKPSQKLLDDGSVELTFYIETFYNLEAFYRDIVPPLVKLLDKIADQKMAEAIPFQFERELDKKTMITNQPYWNSSFVEFRLYTTSFDIIHFDKASGQSLTNFKINEDTLAVALDVGRNHRGTSIRLLIYFMSEKAFGEIFKLSPACAVPFINIVLKDEENSVIYHHRNNSKEQPEIISNDFWSKAYGTEEVYNQGIIRHSFFGLKGVLIRPSFKGITDVLVLEEKIILAEQDLKRLKSAEVFYEHLGFPKERKK